VDRRAEPHSSRLPRVAARGASQDDLALERLSYARNRLKCTPHVVLFDAWYPSKKLLKRNRDYGGYCVCQLTKNRIFDGRALRSSKQQPSWQAVGSLTGGSKSLW
jgi:hypothetical protein